jgi:hypothetical protein
MKPVIQIKKSDRVLVVEDNPQRRMWFQRNIPQARICATPTDALTNVDNSWHVLFLDHDAGVQAEATAGIQGDTFMPVAVAFADIQFPGRVIIHSFNPAGAQRMNCLLARHAQEVFWVPFGTFDIELVD